MRNLIVGLVVGMLVAGGGAAFGQPKFVSDNTCQDWMNLPSTYGYSTVYSGYYASGFKAGYAVAAMSFNQGQMAVPASYTVAEFMAAMDIRCPASPWVRLTDMTRRILTGAP